jgi:hypothetical protein
MSKKLTLQCSQAMCELLANVLRRYADAAYPKGGSECSQSARESLLMSADEIVSAWHQASQSTLISKRLRVMARAAVEYHAQQLAAGEAGPANHRQDYLLSVFAGEAIDDVGYDAAEQKDRAG